MSALSSKAGNSFDNELNEQYLASMLRRPEPVRSENSLWPLMILETLE